MSFNVQHGPTRHATWSFQIKHEGGKDRSYFCHAPVLWIMAWPPGISNLESGPGFAWFDGAIQQTISGFYSIHMIVY